jgi:hypothetical protein
MSGRAGAATGTPTGKKCYCDCHKTVSRFCPAGSAIHRMGDPENSGYFRRRIVATATPILAQTPSGQAAPGAAPHNVVIFVADGLGALSGPGGFRGRTQIMVAFAGRR